MRILLCFLFVLASFCHMEGCVQIGQKAPKFSVDTTEGKIHFPEDFSGKWILLFSYPNVFTPVCSTEIVAFAKASKYFADKNCQLVGISLHAPSLHTKWLEMLGEKYPEVANASNLLLASDLSHKVAKQYNLIHPKLSDDKMLRAVYFIDPRGRVRASFFYPIPNGRNISELKRILAAMQTSDNVENAVTPEGWQEGDDLLFCQPCACKDSKCSAPVKSVEK